jgi:hypothetical protein
MVRHKPRPDRCAEKLAPVHNSQVALAWRLWRYPLPLSINDFDPRRGFRYPQDERAVLDYELQKLARALRVPTGVFLEQEGISKT